MVEVYAPLIQYDFEMETVFTWNTRRLAAVKWASLEKPFGFVYV